MFKKIFFVFILPLFVFANTQLYTIKLAKYKDISLLKKEMDTLPSSLQKQIQILHIDSYYKASTKLTDNKKYLQKMLPAYKKVFHDAFIATATKTIPVQKKDVVLQKKKQETKTVVVPTQEHKQKNTITTQQKKEKTHIASFYDKIKNRRFYLCSYGKTTGWTKILLKVTFKKNIVKYVPLIGKVPPITAQYKFKNERLYLFQKKMFNPRVYSTFAYETPRYYAVSSWMDHTKINTARYYFKEKDARNYLKSLK